MPSGKPVTQDQRDQAVELFAKGYAVQMIAGALNLDMNTVRYMKDKPAFKKKLAEAINLRAESSNYKLHNLYRNSLETVQELLGSKNDHIRLGAARLACESYAAIAKHAEEQQLLQQMESRMEQLQANMQTALPIIETYDAEFRELPPASLNHNENIEECE